MPSTLFGILVSFLGVGSTTAATIYLAGDSTMAKAGGGSGTEGWGEFLRYSFPSSYVVSNKAIGGRSARSFTREGRFQAIADVVKSGDWVVVEFGHNDGGSLTPTDNGRTDCFGDGTQTCQTVRWDDKYLHSVPRCRDVIKRNKPANWGRPARRLIMASLRLF